MRAVKGTGRSSQQLLARNRVNTQPLQRLEPRQPVSSRHDTDLVALSIAKHDSVVTGCGIMIHTLFLSSKPRSVSVLGAAVLLGACASSSTDYPSFATPKPSEDGGRVAMRFPAVAVPDLRAVETPADSLPSELDAALAAINARAMAANSAFSANLDAAQALVSAAAGGAPEADEWTSVQIRLAELTSHHSAAQLAMADLDQLSARAELARSGPDKEAMISELQAVLSQTLGEQAQALANINAQFTSPAR